MHTGSWTRAAATAAAIAALTGCSLLPTQITGQHTAPTAAAQTPAPAPASDAVQMGLDTACQAITAYQADVATHGASRDTFWDLVGDLREAAATNPDLAPLLEPLRGLSPTDLADLDSITGALADACS